MINPLTDPSEKHLDMLRHMLGINDPYANKPISHRNYAAANINDPLFLEMQEVGLIEKYRPDTEYAWYRCTTQGIIIATVSFMNCQMPKNKRRYRQFLNISDCDHRLTFHEFLTRDEYKELR